MLRLQIDSLLRDKKISKYQICKDLGISRTNLNHYVNNDLKRWDIDILERISEYLGVTVTDLIQSDEPLNKKASISKPTGSDHQLTDLEHIIAYSDRLNELRWQMYDATNKLDLYCEKHPNPELYDEYSIDDVINRMYQVLDEIEEISYSFPD